MLIGLHRDMTPIDIEVTRSMVIFKRITLKKGVNFLILRTVYHRVFIYHRLIGPDVGLSSFDFVFF